MRTPLVRMTRPPWLALALLSVVLAARAIALSGLPGTAVPLALTVVIVAAVGVAVAAASVSDGVVGTAQGVSSRYSSIGERGLARLCDPDAAGHVRPRAPGRARVSCR
jgi:Family of unknown function (DUF6412)